MSCPSEHHPFPYTHPFPRPPSKVPRRITPHILPRTLIIHPRLRISIRYSLRPHPRCRQLRIRQTQPRRIRSSRRRRRFLRLTYNLGPRFPPLRLHLLPVLRHWHERFLRERAPRDNRELERLLSERVDEEMILLRQQRIQPPMRVVGLRNDASEQPVPQPRARSERHLAASPFSRQEVRFLTKLTEELEVGGV